LISVFSTKSTCYPMKKVRMNSICSIQNGSWNQARSDELTNYTTLYMILGGYRLKRSGLNLLSQLEIAVMKAYLSSSRFLLKANNKIKTYSRDCVRWRTPPDILRHELPPKREACDKGEMPLFEMPLLK
jgi:hypothetical protein